MLSNQIIFLNFVRVLFSTISSTEDTTVGLAVISLLIYLTKLGTWGSLK